MEERLNMLEAKIDLLLQNVLVYGSSGNGGMGGGEEIYVMDDGDESSGYPKPFDLKFGDDGKGKIEVVKEGYVQIGGYTVHVGEEKISTGEVDVFIVVRISSLGDGQSPDTKILCMSESALFGAQGDLDYIYIPIYKTVSNPDKSDSVAMDLRGMPMTGILESTLEV